MNHIELFAGCGGLSLGLESAGYELLLANELSPMAAETFAFNFLNENFETLSQTNTLPQNTKWLTSRYSDLKNRLRENPFNFPKYQDERAYSDLTNDWQNLQGNLLVGNISTLNHIVESNELFRQQLANGFGSPQRLCLVSGGPPCQSFSMAGKREQHNEKNSLPWEFAKFVELTQPKIALLENVTGILRPFKNLNGEKFYAWYEVAKVFASIGYLPLCVHVNAKYVGAPQNRPRFLMFAVRHDHYEEVKNNLDDGTKRLLEQSIEFFKLVAKQGENLPFGHLKCHNLASNVNDLELSSTVLSNFITHPEQHNTVEAAIGDLKQIAPDEISGYVQNLNEMFGEPINQRERRLLNHDLRRNSDVVKRRFRIYQILQSVNNNAIKKEVLAILKGDSTKLSNDSWCKLSEYRFYVGSGQMITFESRRALEIFLSSHPTKKQTQKALEANKPAPAALSIPDDACHYGEEELRVLTVREMARIQTFPDNFVFRSKITTGGQMRKSEVPQYTQVGNAVPPVLGRAIGKVVAYLLNPYHDREL